MEILDTLLKTKPVFGGLLVFDTLMNVSHIAVDSNKTTVEKKK